jgi:hypothetical protein
MPNKWKGVVRLLQTEMDQKFLDLGKIQGTCVSAQHAKKAAKSINDMVKM